MSEASDEPGGSGPEPAGAPDLAAPGASGDVDGSGSTPTKGPQAEPPRPTSLAEKLERLCEAMRPRGGRPLSSQTIAEAISARGIPISTSYVGYLRDGRRDNPTMRHLQGLAAYFNVPVSYFFHDDADLESQLELLIALRDGNIRTVASRMPELRPETRRWLAMQIPALKALERGSPIEGDDSPGPSDQ